MAPPTSYLGARPPVSFSVVCSLPSAPLIILFLYFVYSALCEIWLPCQRWRGVGFFRRYYWQWCIACALLVVYLGLSYGMYVPDWKFELLSSISMPPTNGSFVYTVTSSTRGDHGPASNAAGMIDRCVLGLNHLYTKPVNRNLKECNISSIDQLSDNSPSWCHTPFDPEGILSSLTAAVTCIIELQYGRILGQLQKQSNSNIDNRNQLKTKHRCGSKSLPVRVHEATIANGGKLPELPCVYKSTHFNDVTKQWISPECEKNYIQAEHCSEPGVVPITPEELSVKVLKPRSGYVKGLGLRRSFSVRSSSASTDSDYVRRLEMEIQKQKEEILSQKEEIQSHEEEITAQKHEIQVQKEEIQAQNKEIGKMNGSIGEHFEITSSIMEFLKKQGFKGQFRGGGIP